MLPFSNQINTTASQPTASLSSTDINNINKQYEALKSKKDSESKATKIRNQRIMEMQSLANKAVLGNMPMGSTPQAQGMPGGSNAE